MNGENRRRNSRKLRSSVHVLRRMLLICLCLSLAAGGTFSAEAKTGKKNSKKSKKESASDELIVTDSKLIEIVVETRKRAFDKVMSRHAKADPKLKKYTYLYVGASRATKLKKSVTDSRTYFATEPGAGSAWFCRPRGKSKSCTMIIRSYLEARPDGNVIIEMGNNCVYYIDAFIYFYGKLIEAYPQAHFWFVDVLPGTGPKRKGQKKNPARRRFNRKLKEAFPDNCIGGYSYLLHSPGFRTTDGTHYPVYVERNLYRYIMEKLGRKIAYSGKNVITLKERKKPDD